MTDKRRYSFRSCERPVVGTSFRNIQSFEISDGDNSVVYTPESGSLLFNTNGIPVEVRLSLDMIEELNNKLFNKLTIAGSTELIPKSAETAVDTINDTLHKSVAGNKVRSVSFQDRDNIFAITPSGSSTAIIYKDTVNNKDPYGVMFQMCFTDPNQGTASADYLKAHTELGTKVGIIYRNDDNYSTGIYTTFKAEADKIGLEIVDTETFVDSDSDYSVQVKKLADAGADIVFLPIYYQPASQILVEAEKQGYAPSFFGCDGMDGILTLENFDVSLAEGLYMLTPFSADATDSKTANFVKKYQEKYKDIPNQFAADAYDCIYAIKQAIDNAGITADMSTDDITAAMIKEFTSMTVDAITGSGMTWSASGDVTKQPKAIVIENGAYVGVE